jgi:hypothetical protein
MTPRRDIWVAQVLFQVHGRMFDGFRDFCELQDRGCNRPIAVINSQPRPLNSGRSTSFFQWQERLTSGCPNLPA